MKETRQGAEETHEAADDEGLSGIGDVGALGDEVELLSGTSVTFGDGDPGWN